MAKMKMSMVLVGAIILVIISVVSTYLVLLLTHVVPNDPIKVEITILDEEKSYDGTPLTASNYEITDGELIKGHRLELIYLGSITDVGIVKSSAEARVYDEDHTDHTKEYEFKIVEGNLVVKKKEVTLIVTNGGNSNENYGASYDIAKGNICAGHKVVPSYTFEGITGEKSKLLASMTAEVFDANGVDVSKNYLLSYQSSVLELVKTPLIFRTLSRTKVFDGTAFRFDELECTLASGVLPDGYTYDASYDYNEKGDAGTKTLELKDIKIYDNYNEDVSYMYDIKFQNLGVLTITPYTLNIEVEPYTAVYDGTEHTNANFKIIGDSKVKVESSGTSFEYLDTTYEVTVDAESMPKLVKVGSIVNNLQYNINNKNGANASANFNINQTSSIITVTKKVLNFTPYRLGTGNQATECSYINLPYKHEEDCYNSAEKISQLVNFVDGDEGFAIVTTKYNYDELFHAGEYRLEPTIYSVISVASNTAVDENELDNYEISISYVNIHIDKATVYIIVDNATVSMGSPTYYGQCDIIMDDNDDDNGVAFDNDFDVNVNPVSINHVGTYSIGVTFEKANENALLTDYNIFITPGTLTVTA